MLTANRFPVDRDGTRRTLSSAFTILQEAEMRTVNQLILDPGAGPQHLQQLFYRHDIWQEGGNYNGEDGPDS